MKDLDLFIFSSIGLGFNMAVNSCKIGLHLNEECHKTSSHTRKEGLLTRVDIKDDDKELLNG